MRRRPWSRVVPDGRPCFDVEGRPFVRDEDVVDFAFGTANSRGIWQQLTRATLNTIDLTSVRRRGVKCGAHAVSQLTRRIWTFFHPHRRRLLSDDVMRPGTTASQTGYRPLSARCACAIGASSRASRCPLQYALDGRRLPRANDVIGTAGRDRARSCTLRVEMKRASADDHGSGKESPSQSLLGRRVSVLRREGVRGAPFK